MFTGIIERTSSVRKVAPQKSVIRVEIEKPKGWKLSNGQSIAVDGICSTVVASKPNSFTVHYIPETLAKTTAGNFKKGTILNVERSLTLAKLIDGHLLQGHIDSRANVRDVQKGRAYLITVHIPKEYTRYVARHGSIALNGVSLTVARLRGPAATVALIPHTLTHTNLGLLKKGDFVNLEVDLIARYLFKRHP